MTGYVGYVNILTVVNEKLKKSLFCDIISQ